MIRFVILLTIALLFGCSEKSEDLPDLNLQKGVYELAKSTRYQLVDPIPEGDQWLLSFQAGNGYQ
ncbi:MAG: hypothetical protein ACJAVK_000916 [Akkermansiaceae bacterium]|jgi:hypothetical protein